MRKSILAGDHKEDYENYIAIHVDEISRICADKHIPFFFCACVANEKNEEGIFVPQYVRTGRTAASFNGIIPNNDEIAKHIRVTRENTSLTTNNDQNDDSIDLDSLCLDDDEAV